jgi:hypothetical protein
VDSFLTALDVVYFPQGKRWWFLFKEKGGKRYDVPAHKTEAYMDAFIQAAEMQMTRKNRCSTVATDS